MIDLHRLRKTTVPAEDTLAQAVAAGRPVDALANGLGPSLDALDADDRDVILRCDIEGQTQAAYAAAHQLTLPAVKRRRAKRPRSRSTDLAGREDAFNPAELLLAALTACMLKGIERVAPMLTFELRSVEVRVHGVRQDVPLRMERIDCAIQVDTDEPDRRLELLHENVRKYGTVFNTVALGTHLSGVLIRAPRGGSPP